MDCGFETQRVSGYGRYGEFALRVRTLLISSGTNDERTAYFVARYVRQQPDERTYVGTGPSLNNNPFAWSGGELSPSLKKNLQHQSWVRRETLAGTDFLGLTDFFWLNYWFLIGFLADLFGWDQSPKSLSRLYLGRQHWGAVFWVQLRAGETCPHLALAHTNPFVEQWYS